jgi:glycosyltransferase involved in cell wall biosynthesis
MNCEYAARKKNNPDKKIKTPAVSIVMSMYNAEKYLGETIDSILEQIFTDFELIIVDDGSTDNSVNIVKAYTDGRIKLVLCEHDYINSLNTGLFCATGKYIARMDADDIMPVDRLEIQYEFMEKNRKLILAQAGCNVSVTGNIL